MVHESLFRAFSQTVGLELGAPPILILAFELLWSLSFKALVFRSNQKESQHPPKFLDRLVVLTRSKSGLGWPKSS